LKKNPEHGSLKMREEFAIIKLPEHVKLPDNDSIGNLSGHIPHIKC